MKRSNPHILYSLLLLFLFAAGQIAIYSHQHNEEIVTRVRHQTAHQTVSEKCQLCDAMHHNAMDITVHTYTTPIIANQYHYIDVTYNFVSISLILAAGRAPPIA